MVLTPSPASVAGATLQRCVAQRYRSPLAHCAAGHLSPGGTAVTAGVRLFSSPPREPWHPRAGPRILRNLSTGEGPAPASGPCSGALVLGLLLLSPTTHLHLPLIGTTATLIAPRHRVGILGALG